MSRRNVEVFLKGTQGCAVCQGAWPHVLSPLQLEGVWIIQCSTGHVVVVLVFVAHVLL